MTYRLGMIGGGNMGSAIVRGGIGAGVFQPANVIVAEVDSTRRDALADIGCALSANPQDAAMAEQIMLAVKPQAFAEVAKAIAPLDDEKVVVSIMAGLNSQRIRAALGTKARVIRAMPNTPCQLGAGMTAIAIGAGAAPGDEQLAVSLFNAVGRTVLVDESLMYAVTAVSASGPAYVFLLAEAMEQAAVALGIDQSVARRLVEQTVMGAGRLLSESSQDAGQLRQAVTSPGGTTAAALSVFEQEKLTDIVVRALTAARDRGRELDRV